MTDHPIDPTAAGRRYEGLVVIVTGAASGIGRATALRIGAEGGKVWCADLNGDGAAATAADIEAAGGTAKASTFDITDVAASAALVADVVAEWGALHVLCNIAGIGGMTHFAEESPERFDLMMAVNARGPYVLTQAALPHLLEVRGTVVNLASTAGIIGQAYCSAYCASKHALVGITKALAIEFGRKGLNVNAVCPGGVNTPILGGFLPPEGASMSLISRAFLDSNMQEPESVAAMVAYLGSPEAHYVNGATFSIDGGTTAG